MNNVEIKTEFIKLDQFLKWVGVADNGSFAKMIIQNGDVKVNNEVAFERGKKLRNGDTIEIEGAGVFKISSTLEE